VQIDRTIPHIKNPDIIIRNSEKETCLLAGTANSGDRNVIKNDAAKILKYIDLTTKTQRLWNVKNKSDIKHKRGNWNQLNIIQKISAQHTEKAHQGTRENSHIRHCTHASETVEVRVQNVYRGI